MFKNLLLTCCLAVLFAGAVVAQTTISSRIAGSSDDAEEYIYTPENESFRTQGSMDVASSDIELGTENPNGQNPSIAGLRFTNLNIPAGAWIVSAEIKFTVDATNKNEDPANYYIHVEDNLAPATFSADSADITSRTWSMDSIAWMLEANSWSTVGGVHSSADLSSLVQMMVNKEGWSEGNALAFFITGTGVREAESFDGSADNAAELVVTYLPVSMAMAQIASSSDDAEEYIYTPENESFRTQGSMDVTSSDIELGTENPNGQNPSIAGLRFNGLGIPKGAKILSAEMAFTVDATNKNEDPANYFIHIEDNVSPATFSADSADITSRMWSNDSIAWNVTPNSWDVVGGVHQTSNFASLVQMMVNKEGWSEGNSMAFFITGTGVREAESFDGAAASAAKLMIKYIPVASIAAQITGSSDDAEEYIYTPQNESFRTQGSMDVTSSDIELGTENPNGQNPSIAGLRFPNLDIPAGALIESAHLVFTVDATNKNEDPANYYIHIEDNINPATFSADSADITSRTWFSDSIAWNVAPGSWDVVGGKQQSADITSLIEAIINKEGWSQGNGLAFFITGEGVREAESFDGSAADAPQLIIEFLQGDVVYKPEVVREIPDQELVQGWDFALDIKPYFVDKDSELSFMAYSTGEDTLPSWITFENGLLSGSFDGVADFPITIEAMSDGKSVTDEFTISYSASSADFTLAIFHNNDGESDLLPDSIVVNGVPTTGGGIGQFKATLDRMRAQASMRGYESVMLSSGDNFLAGLEYNASQANGVFYDAIALDSIDYDAIDLGNHDFDFGTEVLANFIGSFETNKAPYLSSNLSFENVVEMQALVEQNRVVPATIVEKGSEKIGVIGLTTPLISVISSPGNTIISEAIVDSVQKYIDWLTGEGVNKIILISHLQDLNEEINLASQLSDIDVIIAGGGDELISNNPIIGKPYNVNPVGAYPMVAKDNANNDVYIVTTPGNYRYLGNLLIDFDANGLVTKVHKQSDLVLVYGETHQGMVDVIETPIIEYIGDLSTNVIAIAEDSLDFRRETLRHAESNGGNLFADALLWQAKQTHATFGVKEPQVAIQNSGGLRIESLIAPGEFTEDLTYEIAAFTNILSVVEDIAPAKFLQIIEHGVAKAPGLDGRFPQIAGFQIVFDPASPEGNRVISIKLDDGTMIVENGEVVTGAPAITLASIDFTVRDNGIGGGDGYPFFPLTFTTLGATYQQAFLNYLVNGLGGVISKEDYPYNAPKSRIIEQISQVPAVDSVVVNFGEACPENLVNWTLFHTQDNLVSRCAGNEYIQFNGHSSGANGAGQSWLITPRINFDDVDDLVLEFTARNQYARNAGPDVEVFYSTDYVGLGDPTGFTWTNITQATDFLNNDPKPSSGPTASGEIDLSFISEEAYIAVVYYSDGSAGGGSSSFYLYDFSVTPPAEILDGGYKTIAEIQGDGEASSLESFIVITSGIVTAKFGGNEPYTGAGFTSNLTGFYVQDMVGDGNEATSEALYVKSNEAVEVGDSVVIEGVVSESFGLTQLTDIKSVNVLSKGHTVSITEITLPAASRADFEAWENMLVAFTNTFYVTENRNLENFGELRVAADGILYQPTQVVDPNDVPKTGNTANGNSNVSAITAQLEMNGARSFVLDDARSGSNPSPIPYLGADNSLRAGTTIDNLAGIFTYDFSEYRLQPTSVPVFNYAAPDVLPSVGDGALRVVSFNVLNYFNGDGQGGGFPTSRGAATQADFLKQSQKIVAALKELDGDVVGLIEIENDEDNGFSAIKTLVDHLNTEMGVGTYDFVSTGVIGRFAGSADEIKCGFIYKPAKVSLVGNYAILDNEFDANYNDGRSRPALAQTFEEISSNERFTAVINHFKSKGSDCDDLGDLEDGDGQGECNVTRTQSAGTLASWLETDPTGSGDEDFLILGDLNAYAQEDPIDTLRARGYVTLAKDSTYSYVFDGMYGSLDQALANESMTAQVSGSHVWHINSIEPDMFAYNGLASMFSASPYWSSDHDPVLIGLKLDTEVGLNDEKLTLEFTVYPNPSNGIVNFNKTVSGTIVDEYGIEVTKVVDSNKVDLTTYNTGVYFLRLENGESYKMVFLD